MTCRTGLKFCLKTVFSNVAIFVAHVLVRKIYVMMLRTSKKIVENENDAFYMTTDPNKTPLIESEMKSIDQAHNGKRSPKLNKCRSNKHKDKTL